MQQIKCYTASKLERLPKPPLGMAPFHIMETDRDVCGLCGVSAQKVVDEQKEFCPVIMAANDAAARAWESVIEKHV